MVNNCINNILSIFYPQRCLLCGDPGSHSRDLCSSCHQSLHLNTACCAICALPIVEEVGKLHRCGRCQEHPPRYDVLQTPYLYQPPLDNLITGFKYHQQLANGRLLGQLLAAFIQSTKCPLPELLIPIPMHARRLRKRGFNQASELARHLSRQLGIPWKSDVLHRKRWTQPQQGLSRQQRLDNVRSSFHFSSPHHYRHVALIDDVVTTGATIAAATLSLKRAGIARVEVWAIARTPESAQSARFDARNAR